MGPGPWFRCISGQPMRGTSAARVRQVWAQQFEDAPQAVVVATARFGEFFTGSLPHPVLPAEVRARLAGDENENVRREVGG